MTIILASGSPRRKLLLEGLGLSVTVVPPNVDEVLDAHQSPEENAMRLAKEKLESVNAHYENSGLLIVAADTIVVCNGEIFGKPTDRDDAKAMLRKLSGKLHEVITGYAVGKNERTIVGVMKTKVWFREMKDSEIEFYVTNNEILDKSGSYAIQDGGSIIDRMEGSLSNVVGLPVREILEAFKQLEG